MESLITLLPIVLLACGPGPNTPTEGPEKPGPKTNTTPVANAAGEETNSENGPLPFFAIGTGTTEIWSGNAIIGLGYRQRDSMEEFLYLFEQPLAPGPSGWQPTPPSVGVFPNTLSPAPDFDPAATPVQATLRPFQRCNIMGDCAPCDGLDSFCYDSPDEFLGNVQMDGVGALEDLQKRMGNTQIDVETLPKTLVKGVISQGAPFVMLTCMAEASAVGGAPSHVDKATKDEKVVWSYTVDQSVQGQKKQVQFTVFPPDVVNINGFEISNVALPADKSQPPNGSMDEWCQARESACTQGACVWQTTSFVYP